MKFSAVPRQDGPATANTCFGIGRRGSDIDKLKKRQRVIQKKHRHVFTGEGADEPLRMGLGFTGW